MAKEKVYIVLSHKHSLKQGSKTDWEVAESVEFVNQLKRKHISMSSVIADYLNEKMETGSRFGFDDYSKFETYIRTKYDKQIRELDAMYKNTPSEIVEDFVEPAFVDQFGNTRDKTVFDL